MHYQRDYKKIYFLENLERIDHIESLFLTPGNLIRAYESVSLLNSVYRMEGSSCLTSSLQENWRDEV
jgi:hypothetical protein